jgi:hypothetical protein
MRSVVLRAEHRAVTLPAVATAPVWLALPAWISR